MLCLSRKPGDAIVLPELDATITVQWISGGRVRLGIDAPNQVSVTRSEIAAGSPARYRQAQPKASATAAPKQSVLVAIANPLVCLQYSSRLSAEGYDVANVSDALSCIGALRCRSYDLLVVEIRLPWGHGDGVVEVMQQDPEIEAIPAVIINPAASGHEPARVNGCSRFPVSELGVEELVREVRERLHS